MPVLKADLSSDSIGQLIEQLQKYQKKVESAPAKMVENLTKSADEKIQQHLNSITEKDGNVLANAGEFIFGDTGFAYLEGEQAAYLEYGTGIQGAGSPHPLASEVGWTYNSGPRIHTTKNGRVGWVYQESGTGKWRFTEGIPAQMPVYAAAQEVRDEMLSAAKEAMK